MKHWHMAASMALILLAGCAGIARQTTQFYLLEALAEPAPVSELEGEAWLGLGPVTLARYLDRPQMVTRSGPGRLHLAELHQWAGPLQENIAQVLRDNLARLLGSERLVALPGRGLPPLRWQLEVEILRLDAGPGPVARLEARWRLLDGDGQRVSRIERSGLTQPLSAALDDHAGLSRAYSELLAALSAELAAALIGAD